MKTGSAWLAAPGGMVGEESVRKKCLRVEEVFSHCYTLRQNVGFIEVAVQSESFTVKVENVLLAIRCFG